METELEKDIKRMGPTLFNHYYNYAHPDSDLGLFRQLQELNREKEELKRSNNHGH